MADLRYDPVTGVWVAIARNRDSRPMEFVAIDSVQHQLICPFCSGNEDETPGAIALFEMSDGGPRKLEANQSDSDQAWLSRIVPNKFPSLIGPSVDIEPSQSIESGPYAHVKQDGIQEILIPSPRHVTSFSELTDGELITCFFAAQKRLQEIENQNLVQHTMLFMNCRLEAGASLGHIHLQIMGAPTPSPAIMHRQKLDKLNRAEKQQPIVQTVADWERQQQTRMLEVTDNFSVFCPFASRFAFQVWIVPTDMKQPFAEIGSGASQELATLMRKYVTRLESQLKEPAYNILLHQPPTGETSKEDDFSPWYFEIFPRVSRAAGFELGTDIWVNPMPPETAAKRLRT